MFEKLAFEPCISWQKQVIRMLEERLREASHDDARTFYNLYTKHPDILKHSGIDKMLTEQEIFIQHEHCFALFPHL